MSRVKSEATQLREAKSKLRALSSTVAELNENLVDMYARAVRAEKDRDEWKERFDVLLRKEDKK